ncbi:MAG: hypothetical protein ACO36E_07015 [Synechocystis sp.]
MPLSNWLVIWFNLPPPQTLFKSFLARRVATVKTPSMLTDSGFKQKSDNEQQLYDYLLELVQSNDPGQALEEIRDLFLTGRGSRNPQIFRTLETVIKGKYGNQNFNYFFNRCCYIVINYWQLSPQSQRYIPKLVEDIEKTASAAAGQSSSGNIRYLVYQFTQCEQFARLKRLANVINAKFTAKSNSVGTLIHRYPYLYDYCLMGDESSQEHQQTVRRIKAQNERHFEVNLSRYVTYKVRAAQAARGGADRPQTQLINPVKNPTLLGDSELNKSLKHFVGTVENGQTYQSLSRSFSSHIAYTQTYGAFKDELYDYIRNSLSNKYQQGNFNKKLFDLFQNTYPECNHQKPTEFLMMRTSSQLLNFLVVEGSQKPEHYVFIDLISNIGVTRTIGILLKIILFCSKVKPYLEKRFSILFNHYESFTREGVPWLVRTLENMQIALSVHFGKVDLSSLRRSKLVS